MNLYQLKCPSCGAPINNIDDFDFFYCSHCGAKLILDGQSSSVIDAKTKIKIAEQREATKRYNISSKHDSEIRKAEFKHKEEILDKKIIIGLISVVVVCLLALFIYDYFNSPEKNLDKLISNTQNYIASEDFDSARIEANKIHYSGGLFDFAKRKTWNDTRKELLKQIEQLEKEKSKSEKEAAKEQAKLEKEAAKEQAKLEKEAAKEQARLEKEQAKKEKEAAKGDSSSFFDFNWLPWK